MKRLFLLILFLSFSYMKGFSQSKPLLNDMKHIPKTNVKVNKEYDDQGNLIKYDSTYVWSYSNVDTSGMPLDSLFESFGPDFKSEHFFSDDPFNMQMFFDDTTMQKGFDMHGMGDVSLDQQMKRMQQYMRAMDSISREEMRKFMPPGYSDRNIP